MNIWHFSTKFDFLMSTKKLLIRKQLANSKESWFYFADVNQTELPANKGRLHKEYRFGNAKLGTALEYK